MSTNACSNVFAGLDWAVHSHALRVSVITAACLSAARSPMTGLASPS